MKNIYFIKFLMISVIISCKGNNTKEIKIQETSNKLNVDSTTIDSLSTGSKKEILHLISLFKKRDIQAIAEKINYPLEREYPIPAIQTKEEFIKRFDQVFDEYLVKTVANSSITQWKEVGWRGIMLDDGIIWMVNSDGIISTVNYQSEYEKKWINELIASEKSTIHPSLSIYKTPIYKFKTKNYLIRIDEVNDNVYRYASWKVNQTDTAIPDLILTNGEMNFEGSGGNHVIAFTNGEYVYNVYRNILSESEEQDVTLVIEKNGKTILSEAGVLIKQ